MADIEQLKKIASQVRRDIIRMVHAPQSGHPGGSLGCVEFFTALYMGDVMKHDKRFNMEGKNEDDCKSVEHSGNLNANKVYSHEFSSKVQKNNRKLTGDSD